MALKAWQDVVDADLPRGTGSDIHKAIRDQRRWLRGSVRLVTGRVLTAEAFAARREQALKQGL